MSGSSKSLSLFLSELLVSTDVHACRWANDTRPKHETQETLAEISKRFPCPPRCLFPFSYWEIVPRTSTTFQPRSLRYAPFLRLHFLRSIRQFFQPIYVERVRLYRWIIRQSVCVCVCMWSWMTWNSKVWDRHGISWRRYNVLWKLAVYKNVRKDANLQRYDEVWWNLDLRHSTAENGSQIARTKDGKSTR